MYFFFQVLNTPGLNSYLSWLSICYGILIAGVNRAYLLQSLSQSQAQLAAKVLLSAALARDRSLLNQILLNTETETTAWRSQSSRLTESLLQSTARRKTHKSNLETSALWMRCYLHWNRNIFSCLVSGVCVYVWMCVSGSQVAVNEEAFDWRAKTELRIHTGAVEWKWSLDSRRRFKSFVTQATVCVCVWFLTVYDSIGTDGVVSCDRWVHYLSTSTAVIYHKICVFVWMYVFVWNSPVCSCICCIMRLNITI